MRNRPRPRPAFAHSVYGAYRHVSQSGEPFAVRGHVGSNLANLKFVYCENVVLPLGDDDGAVDHLLVFGAYVPRALAKGGR